MDFTVENCNLEWENATFIFGDENDEEPTGIYGPGGVVYNIDLSMYQFDDQEMDDDTIYYKSDSGKEVLVEKLEGGNIIWYDADTDTECVLTLNENKTAYNVGTDCPLEWEVATIIMDEDGQPTGIEGPGGDIFKIDISQQEYEDVPSKFVAESGTEVVFESQGD